MSKPNGTLTLTELSHAVDDVVLQAPDSDVVLCVIRTEKDDRVLAAVHFDPRSNRFILDLGDEVMP